MSAGALSVPASARELPATAKDAELAAIRLGAGGFAAAIEHAAGLLLRGELEPSHPWSAALVWRRVQDLHGVDRLATDSVLAPLLDAPGAAEVLRAVAARDPSGTLELFADALALDAAVEQAAGLLLRGELEPSDSWPAALVDAFARAQVRAGDEFSVLEKLGIVSRADAARARLRFELDWLAGKLEPPCGFNLRQRIAMYESRWDGKPWPDGKGRRPGARNRARVQRLDDLIDRYVALPSETEPWELLLEYAAGRELVAEHAERWKLTLHEARADWRLVQRVLVDTGRCGYRTPLVQAQLSGDAARVRHQRKRLARLRKRLDLQGL